jgi:hypothetical protein
MSKSIFNEVDVARAAIELASARAIITGNESAALCLDDARGLHRQGSFVCAITRAHDSLGHSVGVFHQDTKDCEELALTLGVEL